MAALWSAARRLGRVWLAGPRCDIAAKACRKQGSPRRPWSVNRTAIALQFLRSPSDPIWVGRAFFVRFQIKSAFLGKERSVTDGSSAKLQNRSVPPPQIPAQPVALEFTRRGGQPAYATSVRSLVIHRGQLPAPCRASRGSSAGRKPRFTPSPTASSPPLLPSASRHLPRGT